MLFRFLAISVVAANIGVVLLLVLIDYIKNRKNTKISYPFVSFLVPVYNAQETVESTINDIMNSYPKGKFEVIAINDKSADNSLRILNKLKKDYPSLIILNNEKNIGKAKSINSSLAKTKGKVIFIIDSDIELSRKNIDDMMKRLCHKNVAAVSCRYAVKNTGILDSLQDLEYSMYGLIAGSYNINSSNYLNGSCIAIKKDIFIKVGMLSQNMLAEDTDLAFKINRIGYRIEQSMLPVFTYAPTDFKTWYRQKLRWYTGFIQCYFKNIDVWIKNPITITLGFLFLAMTFNFIWSFFVINSIVENLSSHFFYLACSLPYAWLAIRKPSDNYKLILIIPFMLIYMPIMSLMGVLSFVNYFKTKKEHESGDRAW